MKLQELPPVKHFLQLGSTSWKFHTFPEWSHPLGTTRANTGAVRDISKLNHTSDFLPGRKRFSPEPIRAISLTLARIGRHPSVARVSYLGHFVLKSRLTKKTIISAIPSGVKMVLLSICPVCS